MIIMMPEPTLHALGGGSGGARSPANPGAAGPSSPATPPPPARDFEMEEELAADMRDGDPLASYDVDIADESQAAQHYLALLQPPT
jgi:hypothetical protein